MMAAMASGGPGDPHTQMNTYRSYVTMLADPGAKDEIKLKAAQELSENFEVILSSPQYPQFLDHSLKIFLKILQEGEPHFIAEYNIQQVRKLILEMIHRLPISETLRPYVKSILILMLKLMEIENEENVLVCLKIFMELHKQYRPAYCAEVDIHKFLQWVKAIYVDLPNHLPKIFEPRPSIRVKDLSEYNLIPRSVISLKVIQELPIIVVLMYQLYKQNVHQEVSNFIPLIMDTITLQPTNTLRQSSTFSKEVFVDFMGAQIKTLAFLAYIIRIYQDTIANHATMMVKGIIGLLTSCPPEVAHLRKELVIATRHILATDLRLKFVPYMERLFDENVLLGGGWTVHESLRPLAYSTLADLVHHVRQHLPITDLAIAAHLFSKNVHDESLPTSIQTMSCKLLLNLVDCIRQRSESENAGSGQPQGRQLLMRILEVFVLKFKTISKLQLPALMAKYKQSSPAPNATPTNGTAPSTPTATTPSSSSVEIKLEDEKATPDFLDGLNKAEEKSRIGFPTSQMGNLNVGDYRTLVKTLVCGVKTITWGCASCKKQLSARETLVYIRLVKWGLQSLDIYTLSTPRLPTHPPAQLNVRTKEEKEVLEHFSGVFSMMNPQTFQEIFTATISHMVERINKNTTLQVIANTFLSNPATSPIFATVLVEYLLKRMEEMGSNVERSNLYLRLFKLVFGSVSLFPTENEQMLRPHLHSIVNKAMDYAMTAKEPYNYFLLLRALFRSIGGGSHDLLYQEFLPLLPNLLEGLNRLQSGLHKQHMKDLFVELCLTVPVRLSSLLPYLPMLMDPLVSALNGSHTLISQGLRTLELCVDNLQPDFLYEHIQPVRADLMQALWRTLQNNEVARIAFRVLGKFGGGNRKMMIEPQRLEYRETDAPPPAILTYFQDQAKPIDFEVDKVIETAFSALKSSTTDPFYRRQCWEVLRCYLAASLNLDDDRATLQKLFNHPSFTEGKIPAQSGPYYKCSNSIVRNTHRTALTGMFVAAAIKELRHHVLPTMVSLVRHYTLVAIAQEAGPFAGSGGPKEGLDALVLVDAIAVVMGHEEKELCKPGHLALVLMIETAATVLGSKERACKLPLMEYLAERMSALCYERAWYAKLGGCIAVKFMFEKMAPEWVYKHVFTFLKAVLFVMMDLTGEVSSGALDMATVNLERLLRVCVNGPSGQSAELEGEVAAARSRALHDVLQELVLQVTSPHLLVRQQAMKSLELIAELQNKTVTEVMDPHRDVLAEIIPPKKHLLRHQPANAQMGLMDGTTFCTTLKPRLFTLAEDTVLGKLPCYKGVNLIPLRISTLRALATCHYIQEKHCREKIFQVLYKSLEKNDPELQQAGFECMQKFLSGFQIDMDMVHPVMRPLLLTLGDHRNLSVNGAKRLSYLTQLFPSTFSEKLCEQLLQLLKKLLDYSIQTNRGGNFLQSVSKNMENEQKIIILIGIFHQIPAASPRFIDVLCRLIFHTEKSLMVEAGSPFRDPLFDEQWLSTQHDVIELLKRIWCNDQYHEVHKKVENVDCTHWREPKLIVKILLHYFCHHPSNIDLLFQLLRALCDRFIPDFQFLRDFLENTVAQKYSVEWKRSAFFRFVEHFSSDAMSQELKAKVLQMILIPCFAVSFEKGEKIVGGPPAPYQDNPDNVVSVFINNIPRTFITEPHYSEVRYSQENCFARMEDGNTMLTHWTKKIIVEDGHSVQQLFHILQLVVRHYKVATSPSGALKRVSSDDNSNESRKALNTGWASPQTSTARLEPDAAKPLDRHHVDVVVNLLLRLACQVFSSAEGNAGASANACTALELLVFVAGAVRREQLLSALQPLQRGLAACVASANPRVYEELETLYASVSKYGFEGLANYEKSAPGTGASALLGPLMMLKILALDLLKARVSVMSLETRKTFIGTILVGLIEKTNDAKVMKAITRMVEEWVKTRSPGAASGSASVAPSLREKSILLVKLMQYVEKRFPDDLELNAHFLDLVNYLEPAFLSGLRCPQPLVRAKFFEVFDGSVRRRLYDRLLYVYLLPNISAVISSADSEERKSFTILSNVKEEAADGFSDSLEADKEDVLDMDLDSNSNQKDDLTRNAPNRQRSLNQIVAKQSEFVELARRVRCEQLVAATAQLCHLDDALAHHTWLRLLPRLWAALDDRQLPTLMNEVVPFIISGVHVIQRDQPLSALNTFIEALARCSPTVSIKPPMMKYLGKTHNLWHRMTLNLEQMAIDQAAGRPTRDALEIYDYDVETTLPSEILDSLSDMYELLQEEDMWSGLWQKHARYRETNVAIAYEQQGFFELAQAAYDVAMTKLKQEYSTNPSSYSMHKECTLWTQHWIKCAKELNQWDSLLELGLTRTARDPFLILETWVVNLYRGYLCICAGGDTQLGGVERHAEAAAAQCLREWRRLPRLVGPAHLPLLRAAQQLMELSEAAQIHTGLVHSRPTSLHDMKAIVKTWRNRLPAIIHFAKIARKHNLSGVCLDSLHRIYTIPSVPIVDCFQKIRQQVKCHIQMSWTEGKDELQEGLDMIESTNFKYFTKEMTAEFYAFKGLLLAQLGRSEDANKAFAAAVQLHDTLVKAWALWGDYLEQIFIKDPRQIQAGVSAMTCFLHACRHQNESKSRKYCAKVLWMLSFDDDKGSLSEALDKYSVGVPPVQWLPWIPQLLADADSKLSSLDSLFFLLVCICTN
ncbi:unnamed protein product [Leptidea sinapis]|uniref:FAT domain-containing protein n=1 Tax=Leptidea sinapis TaxID=189913 RepID=A0A5E4QQ65_9NEOP|nr:unnamed protein product [Leptidea sinapis]